MMSTLSSMTSVAFQFPHTLLQHGALAAIVMALLAAAYFSAADADAGQKVATALEELSLVMVLLLVHLLVAKFCGNGDVVRAKKVPSEESESEIDRQDSEPEAHPAMEEDEEHRSQEIGKLTTQIRSAVRVGNMEEAETLMELMQESGGQPGHLRRACWAVAYGEVVNGFVRDSDARAAARWLQAFSEGAPLIRPSTACVNSVIAALGAQGAVAEAESWMAKMPQIGIRVDEDTYSAIISGCAAAGDADRAIHWLREMRRCNMRPSSELRKLVLQSSGEEKKSPAAAAPDPTATTSPAAPAPTSSATELSWRRQPSSPAPEKDRGKDADSDTNWRAAPRESESAKGVCSGEPKECQAVEEKEMARSGEEWGCVSDLEGTWSAGDGDTYEVWWQGATWSCTRWDRAGGATNFIIVYDEADGSYWWGNDWRCFVEERSGQVTWFDAQDWKRRRPALVWSKWEQPQNEDSAWMPREKTPLRWIAKPSQ